MHLWASTLALTKEDEYGILGAFSLLTVVLQKRQIINPENTIGVVVLMTLSI